MSNKASISQCNLFSEATYYEQEIQKLIHENIYI